MSSTHRIAYVLALALMLVIAPSLLGCSPAKDPPANPPPELTEHCLGACEGLRRAKCREGFATPGGVPCETVCITSSASQTWPLACWAGAQSRDEVLACPGAKTQCFPTAN